MNRFKGLALQGSRWGRAMAFDRLETIAAVSLAIFGLVPPTAARQAPAPALGSQGVEQRLINPLTISFRPPPPPNVGSPRERRSAATRGIGCPTTTLPMTALVPVYEGEDVAFGLTLKARPTLWLYLPDGLTPENPGELRTETMGEDGVPVQTTLATLTNAPAGIVGVPLPATVAPLGIGEQRNFLFVVRCDPQDVATNVYVDFTVQRVAASNPLSSTAANITALANAGIWYDLLEAIAAARRQNPGDVSLQADWIELLTSVGLGDVAQAPLTPCCLAP